MQRSKKYKALLRYCGNVSICIAVLTTEVPQQYNFNAPLRCHGHSVTLPLCCWPTCTWQQYKTVDCCHGNATVGSLCTVVELQSILYCNQQYKRA
jgi:hypothetical protein